MTYAEKLQETRGELRALYKVVPDTAKAFGELGKSVKDNGVLGHKEKELIALGMAIVLRCEPCITTHVEALRKTGATREELADVIAMAIQMSGGPGLMYGAKTLACWDDLSAGT